MQQGAVFAGGVEGGASIGDLDAAGIGEGGQSLPFKSVVHPPDGGKGKEQPED